MNEAYQRYLDSDAWAAMRKNMLERFGYRCALCANAGPGAGLQVHHNSYENLFNESVYDLVVLCDGCHEKLKTWDESKELRYILAKLKEILEAIERREKGE